MRTERLVIIEVSPIELRVIYPQTDRASTAALRIESCGDIDPMELDLARVQRDMAACDLLDGTHVEVTVSGTDMVNHGVRVWAGVTLDRNIGAFTGWMGRITRGCSWPSLNGFGCDSLYFGGWNNAGYPDRAPDGTAGAARMYFDYDNGLKANDNNHWYYNDTRPGNSGSPMWVLLDSRTVTSARSTPTATTAAAPTTARG